MNQTMYYRFSVHSKKAEQQLESILKQYAIQKNSYVTPVQEIVPLHEDGVVVEEDGARKDKGTQVPLEFNVLYKHFKDNGGFFSFEKEADLVVGASLPVLDTFLQSLSESEYASKLVLEKAHPVNCGIINFASEPEPPEFIKNYVSSLKHFIAANYSNVYVALQITEKIKWDGRDGDLCTGIIKGPVEDIVVLGQMIRDEGYGVGIKRFEITFSGGEQDGH